MIGLDTYVLVRYFLVDPEQPEQSRLARMTIETALDRGEALFLSNIVLCEAVWVWMQIYKVSREGVQVALHWLLEQPLIELEFPSYIARTVQLFGDSNADFADALILTTHSEAGCVTTYTFDKSAGKLDGFSLLE